MSNIRFAFLQNGRHEQDRSTGVSTVRRWSSYLHRNEIRFNNSEDGDLQNTPQLSS